MYQKPGKKKPKNLKSKAEHNHLKLVASQPCMVCGEWPVQVHHVRILAENRNHFKTIPLCYLHHQGECGIHTKGKKEWYKIYGHETDMLKSLMDKI